MWVALRIMLTIPITMATREKSCKLKLAKTYLQLSMTQNSLKSLAILSVKTDLAKRIDIESDMKKFLSKG